MVAIIVAMTQNRVIGKDNKLLWKLPSDLRRFKNLTMGHPIFMGYKTFKSILDMRGKPLEGRTNLVLTNQHIDEVVAVGGVPVLSANAARFLAAREKKTLFVIGGAQIYTIMLPYVTRLHITTVQSEFDGKTLTGDTYFPKIPNFENAWKKELSTECSLHDEKDEYMYVYEYYVKRKT